MNIAGKPTTIKDALSFPGEEGEEWDVEETELSYIYGNIGTYVGDECLNSVVG